MSPGCTTEQADELSVCRKGQTSSLTCWSQFALSLAKFSICCLSVSSLQVWTLLAGVNTLKLGNIFEFKTKEMPLERH